MFQTTNQINCVNWIHVTIIQHRVTTKLAHPSRPNILFGSGWPGDSPTIWSKDIHLATTSATTHHGLDLQDRQGPHFHHLELSSPCFSVFLWFLLLLCGSKFAEWKERYCSPKHQPSPVHFCHWNSGPTINPGFFSAAVGLQKLSQAAVRQLGFKILLAALDLFQEVPKGSESNGNKHI